MDYSYSSTAANWLEESPAAMPTKKNSDELTSQIEDALSGKMKPDLLLHLVGDAVESNVAREQIRAFLLGTLLKRGIRRGEAVAVIKRTGRSYDARFMIRIGDSSDSIGKASVPVEGFSEAKLAKELAAAGIKETEPTDIFVVTKRSFDSESN